MATNSSRRQTEDTRLLVMGYCGTLRPTEPQSLPPFIESMVQPWLTQASQRLTQRVPQHHCVFQGEPVPLDSLLAPLKDRLIGILTQAIGILDIDANGRSDDVFRQCPLLQPLLRSAVSEWVAAIATFLQRFHQDQSWFPGTLQCSRMPAIESISGTASDSHGGGSSVLRVGFHGGSCLYYKPRPLTGEWLWHALLDAIGHVDPQFRLPAARVFGHDASIRYGWAESVFSEESRFSEFSDVTLQPAVDYWHAAGAMLCLAQHVHLTDLHLANIVATPRGPAVTDAECFASPKRHPSLTDPQLSDAFDTILATGLLPRNHDSDLPDVSGLFGHSAPVPGILLPGWSLSSDGRYRLAPVGAELIDHRNAPAQTTPLSVLPQLLAGYRHAAELMMRARTTLLATGSQWRAILERQHAPRVVLRDTLTYGGLLSHSLQPRYLQSFYRRRSAVLAELQSQAEQNFPPALVRAEVAAILQLHIPRLTILPGSRTVATSSGRAIARRFVASTPAETAFESIETLSPESMDNVHVPGLLAATL